MSFWDSDSVSILLIIFGMFQIHIIINCNNLFRVWVSPLKNRAQSRKYRPMTISNLRGRNTEKNPKIQCHVNQNQTSKRKIFEIFIRKISQKWQIWRKNGSNWVWTSRFNLWPISGIHWYTFQYSKSDTDHPF